MPLRISESAPAGCPKTPTVRERLETHLGGVREASSEEAAFDLAFRIERKGKENHGTVTITAGGVSVERSASSTSCEDVYAALSVMAAIAVGEEAERLISDRVVPPKKTAPSAQPHTHALIAPPTRSPPVRAHTAPPPRIEPGFGTGVGINGNRGPVVMATWFVELTLPFPLDPTLRLGVARSTRERISSRRGDLAVRWSEVTFAGCANLLRRSELRFGPCLSLELGRLEASLLPPLQTRDVSFLWLTLGAAGQFVWRALPQLSVEMTAGAHAPIVRRRLFFEPFTDPVAYHAPLLSPFVLVGFVAHLP